MRARPTGESGPQGTIWQEPRTPPARGKWRSNDFDMRVRESMSVALGDTVETRWLSDEFAR
eukprot:5673330-Pyramimonas_sp.AAC.1